MATRKKATEEEASQPVVGDLVQVASVKADGTVDQTPDFQFHHPEAGQKILEAQIADTKDPDRDVVKAEAADALREVTGAKD